MGQDISKVFDQVLSAAADGPFFPEWEFSTLMGRTRAEFRAAVGTLAPGARVTSEQRFLLAGAINNLLGYPHGQEESWGRWLSATPDDLEQLHVRLKAMGREA